MKEKIIYILLLVALIGVVAFSVVKLNNKKGDNQNNTVEIASNKDPNVSRKENSNEPKDTIKKDLDDGTLYSLTNDDVSADIVIGDNMFDTKINDMMFNPEGYYDKNIEIEGFYLESEPYTFVGRYSTSNLCPYCSAGYSYIEYVWEGEPLELEVENSWIKVIGTLEKGNDETSYYQDYFYIKAKTIEIMNEKGQDTVNN